MKHIHIIILVLVVALSVACAGQSTKRSEKQIVTVSIAPLQVIVEAVANDDFEIEVLVPQGSSPETYSPTPRQLTTVDNSVIFAYLGTLQFENEIVSRLSKNGNQLVNLSTGVEFVGGNAHNHDHDAQNNHHDHASGDPHIWISPKNLAIIAENFADALAAIYPDSTKYRVNAHKFTELMSAKDAEYKAMAAQAPSRTFLIYHPALSYLAAEYGFEQLAIEQDGKEPTPSSVSAVIDQARAEQVGLIMYQSEFPFSAVQSIVEETDIKPVEINPLSSDIVGEMDRIMNIISTGSNER